MNRRCLSVTIVAAALFDAGGCSLLSPRHHAGKPAAPAVRASRTAAPSTPWGFLKRDHSPPPPKAAPLSDVGTVRSVSADGSYVIVELSPGTLVQSGDTLLIPSREHPLARLKVAEVEPPCFAAEVEESTAAIGEVVKR